MRNALLATLCILVLIGAMRLAGPTAADATPTPPPGALPHVGITTPPVPDDITFAGEPVPIDRPQVRERLEKELLITIYRQAPTILTLKRAGRWQPIMQEILRNEGVSEDFFYLAIAESDLTNATSPSGAQGFWQFMRPAAGEYGLTIDTDVDERYNPTKATKAAASYLKDAYKRFGNWTLAAASYNRGMGGISGIKRTQQGTSYYDLELNRETARYIYRIIALKCLLTHPELYGFTLKDYEKYQPQRCRALQVTESIPSLISYAKAQGSDFQTLRLLNPWLRGTSLNVRRGKQYTLYLPAAEGAKDALWMGIVTE